MKIREAWEQDAHNFNKIMLWAAVCPFLGGFLRAGEMTVPSLNGYDEGYHLNFDAIAVDNHSNPSLLWVRIKGSKTGPFREGANIFLRRAHNKLCQVETMLAYLAVRGSAPGFLFKFADQMDMETNYSTIDDLMTLTVQHNHPCRTSMKQHNAE